MRKISALTILSMLICFAWTICSEAQLYKWTDGNGVKHFSNVPPPDEYIEQANESGEIKYSGSNEMPEEQTEPIESAPLKTDEENNRNTNKKRQLAEEYLRKAQNVSGTGKHSTKRMSLLQNIANSFINCRGNGDIEKALEYYREAEKLSEMIKQCERSRLRDLHGKIHISYSPSCIENLFGRANILKKTGDLYLGCSQAYQQNIESEEKIQKAEKEIEQAEDEMRRAKRDAEQAESKARETQRKAHQNWINNGMKGTPP